MVEFALVRIVYADHVLFKNCRIENVKPETREAVGWLARQTENAVWLVSDRPLHSFNRVRDLGNGMVILRKDIQELVEFKPS
jgi:hypothetical protein